MPSDAQTPTPVPQGSASTSAALPGIAQLARETWTLLKDRFLTLIGINVVPLILVIVISAIVAGGAVAAIGFGSKGNGAAIGGIAIIIGLIIFVAMLYLSGVIQAANISAIADSDKPGVGESYKRGFPRGWGMLLASILVCLVIAGGFILVIIPGIIFAVWYMFTYYALMIEKLSAIDAMKRSKALVKGRWWPVFSKIAVIVIIYFIIQWIIAALVGDNKQIGIGSILGTIVGIGFGLFMQIYVFRLYEHLKATR